MFASFGPHSVQSAPVGSFEGGGDHGEGMGTVVAGGSGERKVGGRWRRRSSSVVVVVRGGRGKGEERAVYLRGRWKSRGVVR